MTEAVRKVGQDALEKMVEVISLKCPDSVESIEPDKLKIKLSMVNRETFNVLQGIIDDYNSENLPQKRANKP